MSKRSLLIAGGAVVFILATLFIWYLASQSNKQTAATTQETESVSAPVKTATYNSVVPANLTMPAPTSTDLAAGVAKPATVVPSGSKDTGPMFRLYNISAKSNTFSPNVIIAKVNDNVRISIAAVDKAYDFVQPDLGLKFSVPQGTTNSAVFQVLTPGKFTFYCQSCGGPSAGPVGTITVSK